MPHTALFCKSFAEDFHRLQRLISSHEQYGDGITLILSVPDSDVIAVRQMLPSKGNIFVLKDEDYVDEVDRIEYGWMGQQVCKLLIYKTELADSYLSIDSDAYLVASISQSDFYEYDKLKVVYSNLFTKFSKNNDSLVRYLKSDFALLPESYEPKVEDWGDAHGFDTRLTEFREWLTTSGDDRPVERARWINHLFGVPNYVALQPGQILHARILREMSQFFRDRDIAMSELIRLIPWEYNWYGSWASTFMNESVARTISPILHFASDQDVEDAKALNVTEGRIAERFKVIQMAARHFPTEVF